MKEFKGTKKLQEKLKVRNAAPELLKVCIDLKEILYNISMPAKVMNDLEEAINKALN